MNAVRSDGKVITFYSYKGGTGRSMSLANLAWVLAMAGKRVLAIDWDLEAPGLHRYFHPFLSDPELTSSEGIVDFVVRFIEAASARPADAPREDDWSEPYTRIAHYACSIDYPFPNGGVLDFIPAGKQGDAYAARVNSLNWKHFYERLGGWSVIDRMRDHLRTLYDIVLIDSRTGVSDTAGICTVQLPDTVIVCFTLNFQSIDGASAAARSILVQRTRQKRPVRVLPVPTRVELSAEKVKYDEVSFYALRRFLSSPEQRKPIGDIDGRSYWDSVAVPYIGFYVFEEQLAWFLDRNRTTGVLASTLRLAKYAAGVDALDLSPPSDRERDEVTAQYADVWKERLRTDVDVDYSRVCLVLMPFGTKAVVDEQGQTRTVDFDEVYETVFKPGILALTSFDGRSLEPRRIGQEFYEGPLTQSIFDALEQARFVLADVTGLSLNVLYELGVRYRVRQSATAIFCQLGTKVPVAFDQMRLFPYEPGSPTARALVTRVLEDALPRNTPVRPLPSLVDDPAGNAPQLSSAMLAAENALRVGDRTRAIAAYRDALRIDPHNAPIYLRLGLMLKDNGAWREALEQFDRAVEVQPDYAEAWREKGIAENKLFSRAGTGVRDGIESLRRAIELNPDDSDSLASLGGALKRAGDVAGATDAYSRAADISGLPYPLINFITLQAIQSGTFRMTDRLRPMLDSAERMLQAQVASDPPNDAPWSFFDLAQLKMFSGDPTGALTYASRGVEYASSGWQVETFRNSLKLLVDNHVSLPGLAETIRMLDDRAPFLDERS